jgi:hypothetical protein
MRNLALAMLAAVSMAGPAAAQTYAPGYAVCLHVYGPVIYYECRAAQCVINPYFASAQVPVQRAYRRYRQIY